MPRDLSHPRTMKRFEEWLMRNGAEPRALCDYEVVRYSTCEGKLIIWKNRKGVLTLNPVAQMAFDAFSSGKPLDLRKKIVEPDRAFDLADTDRLLAFVYERERVTVADVTEQVKTDCKLVARRLLDLTRAGRLATSGGGPGDALWFGCA